MTINQAYLEVKRKTLEKDVIEPVKIKLNITNNDNYKLYCKSSFKMNEIDNNSVQCIFTSPPYWNKRKYSNDINEIGAEKTPDLYVKNLYFFFIISFNDFLYSFSYMKFPRNIILSCNIKVTFCASSNDIFDIISGKTICNP